MIREATTIEDDNLLVKIINDMVSYSPNYYEGNINVGDRPYSKEQVLNDFKSELTENVFIKSFMYDVSGVVQGYLKARFQSNMRCSIDVIAMTKEAIISNRKRWIFELMLHLGTYCESNGYTHIQASIPKRNAGIVEISTLFDVNRKLIDNDWGGNIYIEEDISHYILVCQRWLNAN